MSVVPIESETLTSVPCTSGGWLLAGGSHAHRRDGAGMDGSRQVERRRTGSPGDSPMDILLRLPAVVVLERIPGASLALATLVVQLQHCEGWTVRARMSKSALMRRDDQVVLVTFEDLTDQLWMDEQ